MGKINQIVLILGKISTLKPVNMQNFRNLIIFGIAVMTIQSCIPHKSMISLNGGDEVPKDFKSDELMQYTQLKNFEPYMIRPFDQLIIKVNAFDGSTEDFLSREFKQGEFSRDIAYDPAAMYFNSYFVDQSGYINLPLLGDIEVAGLTMDQIKVKLDEAYLPYLKFATTSVKLSNSRVTVFGEVNEPGVYYLYNEKNSILDAISMAGDITEFGNRNKVKLIRLTSTGSETIYLNLHRSDFIYTDYYYIKPHDVIYIEPTKAKSRDAGARFTSLILSGISVGVLILNFVLPN